MIGWRGASRYYDEKFRAAFELECQALKKCRDEMGLTNIKTMIPFCRTLTEARNVLDIMGKQGLTRGTNGFEVYVMCEIPSNVILAEQFADLLMVFQLAQMILLNFTLGVDRDNSSVAHVYSENDEGSKTLIRNVIDIVHKNM